MPTREMLINHAPGEECRIAIVEDGRLEELYQERASAESHVGNIYKAKVVHIEPAIQAAFVDFGLERNGFLHISDLHPMYFGDGSREESERIGKKTPHRDRPPIQSCLRRGQDVLVQVLKEGIGTKGPTLTSYLSIPGRFLVLLPYMERLGVSRKVDDDQSRQEMRKILDELNPPKNFGFIIRTAGIGRTKTDIKRDLAYLQRLWKTIEQRMNNTSGVGELYTESDLVIRTIRDVFSTDIHRVVVDHDAAAQRAKNFLAIASPRSGSTVVVYREAIPLFHRYNIEQQIENIHSRVVPLRSGGSLVIDSTEALVAIDVNSGKNRESRNAETTAYKINLEATDEICRQLRLRDLGGVIVIDLIDMKPIKHRREIEQRFRHHLKRDRARTQTSSISQFGILEMTRQRMRPSLKRSVYVDCAACHGAGQVKSPESVVLDVMRRLAVVMHHPDVARVELMISPDVAFQLLNGKRNQLVALEQQHGKSVTVRVGGGSIDYIHLAPFDIHGSVLQADTLEISHTDTPATQSTIADKEPSPPSDASPTKLRSESVSDTSPAETSDNKPRRRRRRRGGRSKKTDQTNNTTAQPSPNTTQIVSKEQSSSDLSQQTEASGHPKKAASDGKTDQQNHSAPSPGTTRPRRRRRRGTRNANHPEKNQQLTATADETPDEHTAAVPAQINDRAPQSGKRNRRPKAAATDAAAVSGQEN